MKGEIKMKEIRFISYDGRYPNLCRGTLLMEVDGFVRWEFTLHSGGQAFFDSDWNEIVTVGRWTVDVPADLEPYRAEIERLVNAHVPQGCCGGCV